ncbi:MAG TPA: hypothetical protein VE130_12770 [Nitrososphaeraceae archaeon]|nr:hypothetical protein [Nitrososphaeraceae archaeon]
MLDRSTGDTETVADYLIRRLHNYGIRHIFGVPLRIGKKEVIE